MQESKTSDKVESDNVDNSESSEYDSDSGQTEVKNKQKKTNDKKLPGRPRKIPIKEPNPRNGIVAAPKDESNIIEFLYDKPLIFKKLWNFFKLMAVDKIQIIFRFKDIILWCEDHHKKSKIRIKINAPSINHYFCAEEFDIGIKCKNLELIMMSIDKSYNSIVLLSKIGQSQKDIRIILKNEIEIDESHRIELIGEYNKMNHEQMFLDNEYKIKFELPCKYFKKMISDIRLFSDQITIRQDRITEPLIFEYVKSDKKIKSYHIVRNNSNIKFSSNLKNDETFRMSFNIDYVRPISAAILSENIIIYAHEDKPLVFTIALDKSAIEIKILTEIIDNRSSV